MDTFFYQVEEPKLQCNGGHGEEQTPLGDSVYSGIRVLVCLLHRLEHVAGDPPDDDNAYLRVDYTIAFHTETRTAYNIFCSVIV